MAQTTSIEWCDVSWNPVHGCSRVSTGCKNCYAETLSLRYGQTKAPWTARNAAENVMLKPHKLREPLSGAGAWQGLGAAAAAAGKTDGKLVFVNSTSDLFHEQIPTEYIAQAFAVMATAQRHTFQVLTKRPERMREVLTCGVFWSLVAHEIEESGGESAAVPVMARNALPCLRNVWLGVSIENGKWVGRADVLRATPAAVRFISAEPLLGPLIGTWSENVGEFGVSHGWEHVWPDGDTEGEPLDLTGIDWLIVGGESGAGHRPFDVQWARDLRDACLCSYCGGAAVAPGAGCPECKGSGWRTAYFLKQLGGTRPGDRLEDLPEDLRIREFPAVAR